MSVVMGTAGHIDHGKTTLIRALTGTDCDRLDEEKRRGITIELGFAELALPGGRSLSVVDVPGHERFVRTMVAGAAGVDFVLLVIAADEGVMPQTREHLEICALLGIRTGVVALTKIDAVDGEMLALAEDDVASFLAGSVLEGAPVVPVSGRDGRGLDTLVDILAGIEKTLAPVRSLDLFRLPVDRVFTLRGHGTVVTGTMIAGSVTVGDTVELSPGGLRSKVRGLQSHGSAVERALAGRRTAVNIPDLAVEEVRKGEVLCHPDTLFPSLRWAMRLTCLPSSPRALRHRAEVHFHHGAREMQARLYFVDRDRLQPGESCLCEARFSEAAAAVFGDRAVVRSFSPLRTVAGAVVLNPLGVDLRRRSAGFAGRCEQLAGLAGSLAASLAGPLAASLAPSPALSAARSPVPSPGGSPGEAAAPRTDENGECVLTQLLVTEGAAGGMSFSRLRVLANLDSRVLEKALAGLSNRQRAFCFDKDQRLYIADLFLNKLAAACEAGVDEFHRRFPEKQGVRRGELLSGWGKNVPPKLAHFIIERLQRQGALSAEGEYLRRPGHSAAFSSQQAPLSEALLTAYREAGLTPPSGNVLLGELGVSRKEAAPVLSALRSAGRLVRVTEDLWYAAEHLATIETAVRAWFENNENLDVAGLKSITGLSRKYLIALLEYFDDSKLTLRIGDKRVLRSK